MGASFLSGGGASWVRASVLMEEGGRVQKKFVGWGVPPMPSTMGNPVTSSLLVENEHWTGPNVFE